MQVEFQLVDDEMHIVADFLVNKDDALDLYDAISMAMTRPMPGVLSIAESDSLMLEDGNNVLLPGFVHHLDNVKIVGQQHVQVLAVRLDKLKMIWVK